MSSGNDTINFIIRKSAFHPSIKAINRKFKIKSEFSFILVSTETTKRIITDLDDSNFWSNFNLPFKNCDLILGTVTVFFISSLFYFGKNYAIVIEIILFTKSI